MTPAPARPADYAGLHAGDLRAAVRQLTRFIAVYQDALPQVTLPVLLLQACGDPTVHPESAQRIYERLQSQEKHLLWKDINQHVIVGEGYSRVHHDILTLVRQHSPIAGKEKDK